MTEITKERLAIDYIAINCSIHMNFGSKVNHLNAQCRKLN